MDKRKEEKLKQFLNLIWLRPEQALLYVYKSEAFADLEFNSPSLDISCGDGLFMFIHLGGILGEDFDRFQATSAKDFKHGEIHDIHDAYTEDYSVPIEKIPDIKLDYGIDLKQNLLNKAEKLNIYNKLIQHDNSQIPLPFEDNYFKSIYSNSIYWVPEVKTLLKDVKRIMHTKGKAVIEVMTPYWLETLDEFKSFLSPEAIAILDRNRRRTMPGSRPYEEWKEIIINCGFKIEKEKCVFPNKILTDIWNVGLRPISHLMIRMSDSLPKEEKGKIKKEWVDIMMELCKPLLYLPETYSMERAPYISFELKK